MTETIDLIFNVTGQTIYFDCVEGRPSSITSVAVFPATTGDAGTAESATTGSAAVETNPNTTVNATSGAGENNPRKINLTAITGVAVGRSYLLTGSNSEKEWVEIVEVDSDGGDLDVYARSPLHNAFVNTDTFQSTRVSISIDSTWIADSSNISDGDGSPGPGYRARWVYVVDSVTYVKDAYLDVCRYVEQYSVTPADMERFLPSWRNILPTYHRVDGGRKLIAEAYQQVQFDLYSAEVSDSLARDREAMDELVKQKARELILFQRFFESGTGAEVADEGRTQYRARLESLITRTAAMPMGADGTGASTKVTGTSIWSR
jgi:hypothetical protein